MVAKASLRAKLILKCFRSRDTKLMTKAFCDFVRPILEYASVIWNPHYKNQITKIDGVQRFFCKRLQGLWSHPYRSRLAQLGLDSLYCRRVKADLLVCTKRFCITGYIFIVMIFSRSCIDRTRGNSMKLAKTHMYSARGSNFFSNRVINI